MRFVEIVAAELCSLFVPLDYSVALHFADQFDWTRINIRYCFKCYFTVHYSYDYSKLILTVIVLMLVLIELIVLKTFDCSERTSLN